MLKKSKILFQLILLALVSGISGCSEPKEKGHLEQLLFVDRHGDAKVYDRTLSDVTLQANTRLQSESLLMNYKDPLTFNVKAQFLSTESKLVLNAYTTSLTTNDGTRLEFTPNGNSIEVYLFTRDYPLYHFCTIEYAISRNGLIDLSVQLSNLTNSGPSIAVWNMYYDGKNKRKKNYTFLNALSADCSSQDQIFIEHFGSGRQWGFEIQQTRIQTVRRSEAYDL